MNLWRSRCNVSRSPRKTTGSPCKLEGVLKIGRFLLQTACHIGDTTGLDFTTWRSYRGTSIPRGPTLQKIVYEISKSFDFIEITLISGDFTDFIEITVIVKSRKCLHTTSVTRISLLYGPVT